MNLDAIYSVKGFRSLQEFSITLTPGLNVLLGPNGSGKTNFIDFLDFLTNIVNTNVSTAVSSAGGVSRVFSQESLKRKIPRVTAKVTGLAELELFTATKLPRPLFRFEYEVDIRYSKFYTAVYIANEKVKFKSRFDTSDQTDSDSTVGSIEIHRSSPLAEDEIRWSVGPHLLSNVPRNPLKVLHTHRLPSKTPAGVSRLDARKQLLAQPPIVSPDESILSARSAFPAFDAVRQAIARGQAFNLNPQRARTPDDISSRPFIGPDGSGLSSTIYHMQKLRNSEIRTTMVSRRTPKDALDTIVSWTRLVMPDLSDISATADPHTGKYIAYLHVGNGDKSLKIPLQSASDGTLRWLTFACLIVSGGAQYTFEEPENYLHPKMQQFLIDLMREAINASDGRDRYILSTHSETVINQCHPSEIILFTFDGCETKCKRISNSEKLVEQVNKTGFGLGKYYAMNAMR